MNSLNLQDVLRRKYDDNESPSKKKWKRSVLRDHHESSKCVSSLLEESRSSRTRLERSLDETRDFIDTKSSGRKYSIEYQSALSKFYKNLEEAEEERNAEAIDIKKVVVPRPVKPNVSNKPTVC